MEITETQSDAMDVLVRRGYAITHFYADGAVRMAERDEPADDSDRLAVFVRADGTVSPPATRRAQLERVSLEGLGLVVMTGPERPVAVDSLRERASS
jgi:hypothetical protein